MKYFFYRWLIVLTAISCREKYEVILPPAQTSFLVVEGAILTNGITKINLSRTTALSEKNMLFELGATVAIESDHNTVFPLTGKDSGRYESSVLDLDEEVKYRIRIKTKDNLEYVSGYLQPVKTPVIDTITWTRYNNGIEIFVNAKDPINNTLYYRWEYDEAWEFESPYKQYVYPVVTHNPLRVTLKYYDSADHSKYNDTIAICWQFRNSTTIKLGTTSRLSENKVYVPMVYYPKGAWEFSKLYSINIRQYGMNKEEYEFLQKMKKNTESLGTIFDAQPSEIIGNIRCLSDTTKVIIGYVGVTKLQEKRTFINNNDLKDWDYGKYCGPLRVPNIQDSLIRYYYFDLYGPIAIIENTVYSVYKECLDCTLRGTNKKPSYWP